MFFHKNKSCYFVKFYKTLSLMLLLFVFKHLSGIYLRSIHFIMDFLIPLSGIYIVDGYRQMASLAAELLYHGLDYCVSYLLL